MEILKAPLLGSDVPVGLEPSRTVQQDLSAYQCERAHAKRAGGKGQGSDNARPGPEQTARQCPL